MIKWLAHVVFAYGLTLWTGSIALASGDVALITALQGKVFRTTVSGPTPLDAFVKLKEGDRLTLSRDTMVRLVYFASGRQETWHGEGKLLVQPAQSEATGMAPAELRTLPPLVVKQIAKTPSLDSQGRAGVTRLRAVVPPDALSKLEAEYDRMRIEGGGEDLDAEIFLLSGLFELRQLERLEARIRELSSKQQGNTATKALVEFYQKALADRKVKSE